MTLPRHRRWTLSAAAVLACALSAAAPGVIAGVMAGDAAPGAAAKAANRGAAPEKTQPRPLLWKVSDGDNALYLLGSFHLLKPDDYPLSADVDAAFDDAERVVFEVPPAELADPAVAGKMQSAATFSDERRLSTVLPATEREKLVRLMGADRFAMLEPFEPWFVNLSLLMGTSQAMGFRPDQGLDRHLMQRAADAGKATGGLESVDQQLAALDATPIEEQIAGIRQFLDNPLEVPRTLDNLHKAWREADIERLSALSIEDMRRTTPESYRLINVQRNDNWVPQLRQMLDEAGEDDVLVVVGAMHLLGDDGIVAKLTGQGYAVERVCSDCAAAE